MKLKARSYSLSGPSFNRALALFVALGLGTSALSLFAKDHEDKDKTPNDSTSAHSRDANPGAYEQEDINAKTEPEKFIRSVSECSMNDLRLSTMATQRAQNQEVKQFAGKIVQDHTKVNTELSRLAQQKNIKLDTHATAGRNTDLTSPDLARDRVRAPGTTPAPATPSTPRDSSADVGTARGGGARDLTAASRKETEHQVYERLSSLSGKAFDDAYMTHMVRSHIKSVAKFEKASTDLEDGELKQFVESTLPGLRDHLVMAQRIAPPDANRLNVRERTGKDSDYKKDQDKPNNKQDQDKPNN